MNSFTEALKKMKVVMREAGYPGAEIDVHLPLADIDAVEREETVARAIIEESIHSKMFPRLSKSLCKIDGVDVYVKMR